MTYTLPGTYVRQSENGYDLVSPSSGITVSVTDQKNILLFKIVSPENAVAVAYTFETDDWAEACTMYAQAWVTWVTAEIGLGFHPDTPAEDYTPGLPEPLKAEYDTMINFASACLDDIYAVGLEAMQRLDMAKSATLH
jgi:hypothetical protein